MAATHAASRSSRCPIAERGAFVDAQLVKNGCRNRPASGRPFDKDVSATASTFPGRTKRAISARLRRTRNPSAPAHERCKAVFEFPSVNEMRCGTNCAASFSAPIVFVPALPALRVSLRRRTCRARNGIGERLPLSAFQLHARSRRPEWPATRRKDATTRVGTTSRPPCWQTRRRTTRSKAPGKRPPRCCRSPRGARSAKREAHPHRDLHTRRSDDDRRDDARVRRFRLPVPRHSIGTPCARRSDRATAAPPSAKPAAREHRIASGRPTFRTSTTGCRTTRDR